MNNGCQARIRVPRAMCGVATEQEQDQCRGNRSLQYRREDIGYTASIVGLLSILVPKLATASLTPTLEDRAVTAGWNKVIFSPPFNAGWTDPRVLYARVVSLSTGALRATWENYSPEPPLVYFPIYRSTDGGVSWTSIGKVTDTVNDWGLRYQPFLYELPQAIGNYARGTILAAANSIPTDLSKSKVDIYASTNGGVAWSFVSSAGTGGVSKPTNGLTPVWEPLLMRRDSA
ncbi:bnr asp-box repeat domain protein [Seiridium cupressi]